MVSGVKVFRSPFHRGLLVDYPSGGFLTLASSKKGCKKNFILKPILLIPFLPLKETELILLPPCSSINLSVSVDGSILTKIFLLIYILIIITKPLIFSIL